MAKKVSKKDVETTIFLVVLGGIGYVCNWIYNTIGVLGILIAIGVLILAYIIIRYEKSKAIKLQYLSLIDKYNDEMVVKDIISKKIWIGETSEQLLDSLGSPADIDEIILKKCRREVWKYNSIGKNRFALRITIEDGLVTEWTRR